MTFSLIRGDATSIPLADDSVDLIVTSPPYFALRSYTDGGEAYEGQIGSEATPQAFLEALWAVTAECRRVLKPSGSMGVNLGDKYSQRTQTRRSSHQPGMFEGKFPEFEDTWAERAAAGAVRMPHQNIVEGGTSIPEKSLMGLPWRYAIGCIDQLGLILRAEIVWAKPNGLPESVTDRVRRSHEQWFHFTKEPRYFSAVDEIREEYAPGTAERYASGYIAGPDEGSHQGPLRSERTPGTCNPLGKLPGSVWTVPTEPLRVPDHLGVDHFAAFPSEWPRRLILGWSPSGVCVECGEGRRPVVAKELHFTQARHSRPKQGEGYKAGHLGVPGTNEATITGYACACPDTTAPTRPAVVLDPFCGTGTVPAVAHVLGRHGIGIDLSADYLRLAEWRCNDPALRAKVLRVDKPKAVPDGQMGLFGGAV